MKAKFERAVTLLNDMVQNEPVNSEIIFKKAKELGIGERTVNSAKKELGIVSIRTNKTWSFIRRREKNV